MNIKAQVCGLVLMGILLYYYLRQRKLRLYTGKAFFRALLVTITGVALDALSIVGIAYMDVWPLTLVRGICKAYLCSIVGVSMSALMYCLVDIYEVDEFRNRRLNRRFAVVMLVSSVLIFALPIGIYRGDIDSDVYTYGPSVIATYVISFFTLLSVFYTIIWRRGKMNPLRREAVLFWMLLWMASSFLQFLNNRWLLVGYAASLGMMILYLKLENPETYLDRRTGLFNQTAFGQYLSQIYGRGEHASLIEVVLLHMLNENAMQSEVTPEIQMEIALYLYGIRNASCFVLSGDEYMIVPDDAAQTDVILAVLADRFEEGWGEGGSVRVRAHYGRVADTSVVARSEDLLALLRFGRQKNSAYAMNDVYDVDENLLRAMDSEMEVERLILDAMEHDRVEVFYQPIYSTREQCFTSAEALCRIRDHDGNIVPPSQFIPIAEQNGMILRLGQIVFEKVCGFLQQNKGCYPNLHYIEINLSVVQCAYDRLAEDFIQVMERYAISPAWINLEITESASLSAKKILLENMSKLMNYGVRFSLDDFGTGQSNLNYIIEMPVDIVKFDREMTVSYFENGKAKYVMDAAMSMIHGLRLAIVSEGIETKEQYDTVEELGIDYVQGFYFSKPLPEREFLTFMRN